MFNGNVGVSVPQDYRVTLSVSVDNRTLAMVGLLILGAIGYAKARRK